jgi:hypothetical protein
VSAVLELRGGSPRHFLDLKDFTTAQLRALLDDREKNAGRQDAGDDF